MDDTSGVSLCKEPGESSLPPSYCQLMCSSRRE